MLDEDVLPDYSSDEDHPNNTEKVATSSIVHDSSFADFCLKPEILRAIADSGFEHPSAVQHECIPAAKLGSDILCQAKSGMGKTAVFVLSTLHCIEKDNDGITALVITHTKELAYQILEEFNRFAKYLPYIKTKVVCGGVPLRQNKRELSLAKPNILIGTPGRLLRLVSDKDIDLGQLKFFILDECDQIIDDLDMRSDIQQIFKSTPHIKQVMMFSATLSEDTRAVCKRFMHNPREIYIDDKAKLSLDGLQQYYVNLKEEQKNRKLVNLLDALEFNQVVIFVSSVARADALNKLLQIEKFPSVCVHSGLTKDKRIDLFKEFKKFQARILVATNMYGRGIDLARVNVVINYDMPKNEDTYLHRVGRAGRFGTKGLAISFVSSDKDREVMENVRTQFVVKLPELPEKFDCSTYMT